MEAGKLQDDMQECLSSSWTLDGNVKLVVGPNVT